MILEKLHTCLRVTNSLIKVWKKKSSENIDFCIQLFRKLYEIVQLQYSNKYNYQLRERNLSVCQKHLTKKSFFVWSNLTFQFVSKSSFEIIDSPVKSLQVRQTKKLQSRLSCPGLFFTWEVCSQNIVWSERKN